MQKNQTTFPSDDDFVEIDPMPNSVLQKLNEMAESAKQTVDELKDYSLPKCHVSENYRYTMSRKKNRLMSYVGEGW